MRSRLIEETARSDTPIKVFYQRHCSGLSDDPITYKYLDYIGTWDIGGDPLMPTSPLHRGYTSAAHRKDLLCCSTGIENRGWSTLRGNWPCVGEKRGACMSPSIEGSSFCQIMVTSQ